MKQVDVAAQSCALNVIESCPFFVCTWKCRSLYRQVPLLRTAATRHIVDIGGHTSVDRSRERYHRHRKREEPRKRISWPEKWHTRTNLATCREGTSTPRERYKCEAAPWEEFGDFDTLFPFAPISSGPRISCKLPRVWSLRSFEKREVGLL